jgi:hypothetical protein
MSRDRLYSKLRVFVASPGDVSEERDNVVRIAEKLNQSGGAADQAGVTLEVIRWETHVAPLMGNPQEVILEQLPVDTWDIFIGVLWMRFGTPTGGKSPHTGEDYQAGTEKEFDLAYRSWLKNKRPQISFYKCIRPPHDTEEINTEQLERVNKFFSKFKESGPYPGLYTKYSELEDFEGKLDKNLAMIIQKLLKPIAQHKANLSKQLLINSGFFVQAPQEAVNVKEELKQGNVYDVAFLSVDIEGHSQIVRRYRQTPVLTQKLIDHFYDFSLRNVKFYDGEEFDWKCDGGIFIFWGVRYRERCILAGLMILKALETFNLDRGQNPLSEPISIRMAANYALIKYPKNKKTYSSDALNLTDKLQKKHTNNGEFCITTALLDGLDSRFTNIFFFKGRFEEEPIYSYETVKEDTKVTEKKMSFLLEACMKDKNQVMHLFQKKSALSQKDLEQISASYDVICSTLEIFCRWFEMIDEKWSVDFLKYAFDIASDLLTQESNVWETIDKTYRQLPKTSTYFREYEEVVVNVWASRRSRTVTVLNKIREDLQCMIEGTDIIKQPEEREKEFIDKLKYFLEADELDEEKALFDLLLNSETELLDYILTESNKEKQMLILEKLWELADLLLQHHLYFHGSIQRRRSKKILTTLGEEPVKDDRFSALNELLSQAEVDNIDIVNRKFKNFHSSSYQQEKFTEIVWICLSLGHPNQKTRWFAYGKMSDKSILQIIARSRVPLELIYYIGSRFAKSPKDDYKKIFFDCMRTQICQAIAEVKSKESLLRISNLFEIFKDFSFLVETLYFDRYDEMLSRFIEKITQMGMKIRYLEDYRKELDKLRQEKGAPHGSIPKIDIKKLPPHIRRRLASEAPYVDIFITDRDHRIAKETLRHIRQDNVKKILQNTEINLQLMLDILKKKELFSQQDVLTTALKNPKCITEFAQRYMHSYGRSEQSRRALFSIARDAGNAEIKSLARQKIAQLGWHFKIV